MRIIKPYTLTLNSCSVSETNAVDGATWSSGTTYAAGTKVRYQHVSYRSLKDSNVGNIPPDNLVGDDPWWQKLIATMPYRMLDDFVESQTEASVGNDLTFSVAFNLADSIALLNVECGTLEISIVENGTTVFSDTVNMVDDIDSVSIYEYYFSAVTMKDAYINTNLPLCLNGTMTVTLHPTDSTSQAKIGHVILGRHRYIGETKYGAEIALTDYSKKIIDDFGYVTFVKRSYSKHATLNLFVRPEYVTGVVNFLSDVRATPILVDGSNGDDGYEALTVYGWIEDWRTVYEGPRENELSVEVQGLI